MFYIKARRGEACLLTKERGVEADRREEKRDGGVVFVYGGNKIQAPGELDGFYLRIVILMMTDTVSIPCCPIASSRVGRRVEDGVEKCGSTEGEKKTSSTKREHASLSWIG